MQGHIYHQLGHEPRNDLTHQTRKGSRRQPSDGVFLFLFFNTALIPCGKFGSPLGKVTAATRTALPSPTSACWVFLRFRNPPNSDMDYRIFDVRTWSFLCVHICIHMEVGHTNSVGQHNIFDSKKLISFLLRSWLDSNPGHAMWSLTLLTKLATPPPQYKYARLLHVHLGG